MYYFIYCKGPNEKRFTLCNPWKGTRGMGKVYAPRFLKDQADYAVAWMPYSLSFLLAGKFSDMWVRPGVNTGRRGPACTGRTI